MSEENRSDRNRDDEVRDDSNREETPGRQKISREDTGAHDDQNKSGVDKLIDKAQEKGIFDKAAKTLKDKFGGGSKGR
ncbi:MAG: hypothetical protein M3494_08575 [Actinomycetota bacterium]|nr:hypothetical protein [Rubrobacter sp.]MDQ3508053.1 hypothetical protein [Actinomycetota bacterium]